MKKLLKWSTWTTKSPVLVGRKLLSLLALFAQPDQTCDNLKSNKKGRFTYHFHWVSLSDDLADDLGDVDFEDPGNADDEGWETEDEMEAEAEQDDSELTFSKHIGSILSRVLCSYDQAESVFLSCFSILCLGSVFCVSLDPATNSMAVTGGEDDKAYVWRVNDGEVLFECAGEC